MADDNKQRQWLKTETKMTGVGFNRRHWHTAGLFSTEIKRQTEGQKREGKRGGRRQNRHVLLPPTFKVNCSKRAAAAADCHPGDASAICAQAASHRRQSAIGSKSQFWQNTLSARRRLSCNYQLNNLTWCVSMSRRGKSGKRERNGEKGRNDKKEVEQEGVVGKALFGCKAGCLGPRRVWLSVRLASHPPPTGRHPPPRRGSLLLQAAGRSWPLLYYSLLF